MSNQPSPSLPPGPPLPGMFARYKDLVEQGLVAVVPEATSDNSDNPDNAGHSDDINLLLRYHLGWADRYGSPTPNAASQGKALRPTLCMFACEALAGDPGRAVCAAASIELIHNFSLIHDDIQDQDLERRHQPTVWALWGQPRALSAGDAMQSIGDLAMLRSVEAGVPPATALRVSRLLTEGSLEMIEGQCRDLGFESRTGITTDDYLGMIACKTGALIRSAVEIGATLASDDPAVTAAFADFGSCLGRAFQIRDDYLGVWGDASATGKSADNDIRRRKKAFPAVFALERAAGAARDDLYRIYAQDELDDADVERVMAIMDELGAAPYAEKLTQESAEQATHALENIALPDWARREVDQLIDFLANRQF